MPRIIGLVYQQVVKNQQVCRSTAVSPLPPPHPTPPLLYTGPERRKKSRQLAPTESRISANEGQVKIIYKCLVPIYVFPEIKLLFQNQNYNVLSPSSYIHISMRDLYISRIGLPILHVDQSWEYICRSQTHECGNWD